MSPDEKNRMYLRMITIRVRPGRMDQAIRIFQRSISPVLHQQEGFISFSLMENRERSELVGMSHWETERDLLALEENGFIDQQVAKLSTVLSEPPTGVFYKLIPPM